MGFSKQDYWSVLPFPPAQGISLTQGSNPLLLHCLHCRQILYHWTTWGAPGSYAWDLKCHIHFSPKQKGTGLHSKAPCLLSVVLRPGQRAGEAAPGPRAFPWAPPAFPRRPAQLGYSRLDADNHLSSWHSHAQFKPSPKNTKGFQSVPWLGADSGGSPSLATKY